MNNSRTSTNKKKVINNKKNIKKVSASPASSKTRKNIKQTKQKINNHNSKNNIRLNRTNFVDEGKRIEQVTPNRVKMVSPENDNIRKTERKNNSTIIIRLLFIIVIIGIIFYLLFTQDYFNLENIVVDGNEKYTQEDIINKIDLKKGENVFKQLIFSNRSAIALAYVSKVNYIYTFPNTITVKVKERYPAYIALNKSNNKYYKLDNDGYILEECDLSLKKEELVVEGMELGQNPTLGQKIDESYIKKLETYNNIKNLLKKYEIPGEVTNVKFNTSLTIITLDGKLKVTFSNDSNLEYKVSFLKSIIQKNGGTVEGSIDMSVENPIYSKYN